MKPMKLGNDIKSHWQAFAKTFHLDEIDEKSVQYTECRKVFYSAYGIVLMYMSNDIAELSEDDAVVILGKMVADIEIFIKRDCSIR